MKNSRYEIYLRTSTNRSQTNQPAQFLGGIFQRFLNSQSMQIAKAGVTSCIQNLQMVSCVSPKVSFTPSLNAECCLTANQATGAFTSAEHYTDLTPFNSVRHTANQSQLPACCSPEMPAAKLAHVFWLSVPFWHQKCRGLTPSSSDQHSCNQCLLFSNTI